MSGIKIDLAELDIFSLLETLKSETTVLEGLHAFGFRGADVGKLAALELKTGQEKYALDIRDNGVVFLNDLEADDRYKGWPGSVQVKDKKVDQRCYVRVRVCMFLAILYWLKLVG